MGIEQGPDHNPREEDRMRGALINGGARGRRAGDE